MDALSLHPLCIAAKLCHPIAECPPAIRCGKVRRAATLRVPSECATTTVYLFCHSHDER